MPDSEGPADSAPPATASISASTGQILDSAPDAMLIIDRTGTIRLVNRQAEGLFDYDRDELIGQSVDMLVPDRARTAHPGHRDVYFRSPVTRPMGAGLELAARRRDGSEFPVDIALSSLDTDEGVLVTAAVRDVTDRKRFEEERADLQARLVDAQRDEERLLLEAQLQQAQRLESIGQLAGGVAHDFNNLLAAIMNYASLIAANLDQEIDRRGLTGGEAFAVIRQDVEEITGIARRAATLTHQLLIFSRREIVRSEVLDLNSVVEDTEKLLRRTIGEDLELRTTLGADVPLIMADRGQVEQVLMNLAVNARDAMALHRGGRLVIETQGVQLEEDDLAVPGLAPGRYARLSVSDTGSGMSREVAGRAFEPFFTTKPKDKGSGLGLATVYGIVTQAGGSVVIYSEPGLGTTIRVLLPQSSMAEAEAQAQRTRPTHPAAPRGETILLVEDEGIVREPARRILIQAGYKVLAAANAAEALDTVRDHSGPIDLMLTDVVMPGRSGKELAADIEELRPGTRVLFMSGYSYDVIVHQGVLDEGVNLIEKPFSSDALLRKVRAACDEPPT